THASAVCSGDNAVIDLSGMLPFGTFTLNYTIAGVAQPALVVSSNSFGQGSFNVAVTSANNGQLLVVTDMTTNNVTACSQTFSSNNSVTLSVNPLPVFSASGTDATCNGSNNGKITVNVSVGTAPYHYSLDGGSTYPYVVSPITGLAP